MEIITLRNGVDMPKLGYGVFQIAKDDTACCVADAIETGYRHIDTAQSYFNESEVGDGIKASGIDRKELFVTTKVWLEHYGYEQTLKSVEVSLRKLKTDYIDLLLLHQPFSDVYGSWHALGALQGRRGARHRREQLLPVPSRGPHRVQRDRADGQPDRDQSVQPAG